MIVEDIEFDVGEASKATVVDSNYGYDVDGTVGYDFGAFRVETEVGYRRATVDGISSTVATPIYANGGLANLAAGNYDFAGGSTSALSFMRSEEHTSELHSLMRSSYAVFCLKKKN